MKLKALKMDFVSSSTLDEKGDKRISFILSKVRDGSIMVTDAVLHPKEEMDLIKETMRRVDDGFPGIEVCSLKKQTRGLQHFSESFTDQKEKIAEDVWDDAKIRPEDRHNAYWTCEDNQKDKEES